MAAMANGRMSPDNYKASFSLRSGHCILVTCAKEVFLLAKCIITRASDFFQDWWAKVTHGAINGGPFSEMMGPSISN